MATVRNITGAQIKGTKVQKNLSVARALLNIVFESIHDGFGDRVSITWEEIAKIETKIEESWPHVETLFDNTCAQCLDTCWYVRDERRKDALTRLIYAKIIMGVKERELAGGVIYPRVILPGLQTVVTVVLSSREWKILNDHARFIFEYIGSDDDIMIANQIKLNHAVRLLCQRVFLTLLLRFKGFNTRRQEFIRLINHGAIDTNYRMSDVEFCEIFEVLFREFHDMIESDEGRLRLAISHTEDFPERLLGVFDAYFRYKAGVAAAKTMPGTSGA